MGECQIWTPMLVAKKLRVAQAKVLLRQAVIIILSLIIGYTAHLVKVELRDLFAEYKVTILNSVSAHEVSRSQNSGETQAIQVASEAKTSPNNHANGDLVSLIRKYDWDADYAIKIMNCESSGDPSKIGDKHLKRPSFGLFQVNTHFNPQYDEAKLLEPAYNINAAYEIYKQGGWGRWSCNKLI